MFSPGTIWPCALRLLRRSRILQKTHKICSLLVWLALIALVSHTCQNRCISLNISILLILFQNALGSLDLLILHLGIFKLTPFSPRLRAVGRLLILFGTRLLLVILLNSGGVILHSFVICVNVAFAYSLSWWIPILLL